MNREHIRSVATKGEESPHVADVADWLADVLEAVPEGETWTTRELLAHLASLEDEPLPTKTLNQTLWRLRKSGTIPDLWTTDPQRRYMGNNLILWQRPGADEGSIF